jgi:predicted ester cyclase
VTTTEMTNVDLCRLAQRELFGGGRLELAADLIAADCVDHGVDVGPGAGNGETAPRGPEGIKGVVRWLRGSFPDLSYEIDDAFGAGDRVTLRCTARGTHAGEFLGRPPTGRPFAVQQIHVFRVRDGKIAEHWACRDDAGMMHQLGLAG